MRLLTAFLAIAISAPTALAAQRSSRPITPKSRDSAGVRILEHSADALDRAPLLSLVPGPLAIVGKNDTTIDLSKVYSEVLVMHDGSIVFFDDGSVQIVSPDGTRRQRIGRAGAGPKEFRNADVARGRGDTILVTDLGNSRIAWVTPANGVVRTRALKLNREGYAFGPIAQFGHDTLIMGIAEYTAQFTKPGHRVTFPVGMLTGASDSIRVILPLEGGEMAPMPAALAKARSGFTTVAVRYPPKPVVVDWGKGFLAVRPDHWKLDLYHANGTLASSVRVPLRSEPVTSQVRDRDVEGALAVMQRRASTTNRPFDAAAERTHLRALPYPDSLPAFADVKTSATGVAWVREQRLAGDTTWTYTAVAVDGRILGRLTGSGHIPAAFGDDRVVLRDEDSDGLITWRVMRIKW
ncbi:MAG TPA: hypothetical protein VGM77_06010 [Gemmatimonadales bacterium]|jgi:hypothetical protein